MPIAELDRAAAHAIGSASAISDPCSVVRELIDNALDANATIISVELSANLLDSIHVKDNGLGIPPEDRELICRQNCTSKIKTLDDLKHVGGKLLGFRGQALASTTQMSESTVIITRITAETTASILGFGRAGDILSKGMVAHPVGTSVRVSGFLKYLPVRRQMVLKSLSKIVSRIKKALQNYALSRPCVRLSLKISRQKRGFAWIYAPKQSPSVADAISKIIGAEVAAHCLEQSLTYNDPNPENSDEGKSTAQVHAVIPKLDADISKLENKGQFIFVDGRPLSTSKGIAKDLVKIYKSYINRTFGRPSTSAITDPFMYLYLSCPPGIYDVNVDPSKDDVLFADSRSILCLAEDLFGKMYDNEQLGDERQSETYRGSHQQEEMFRGTSDTEGNLFKRPEPTMIFPLPEQRRLRRPSPGKLHAHSRQKRECAHKEKHATDVALNPWTLARRTSTQRHRDPNSHLLTPSRSPQSLIDNVSVPQNGRRSANRTPHLAISPGAIDNVEVSPIQTKTLKIKSHRKRMHRGSRKPEGECGVSIYKHAINRAQSDFGTSPDKTPNSVATSQHLENEALQIALSERFGKWTPGLNIGSLVSPAVTERGGTLPFPVKTNIQNGTLPGTLRPTHSHPEFLYSECHKKLAVHPQCMVEQEMHQPKSKIDSLNAPYPTRSATFIMSPKAQSVVAKDSAMLIRKATKLPFNTPQAHSQTIQYQNQREIRDERMPGQEETLKVSTIHHLATSQVDTTAEVELLNRQLCGIDSYIQTGNISPALVEPCPASTIEQWRATILDFITGQFRSESTDVCTRLYLDSNSLFPTV
ncbi:DNA mismatch repair protein mutL [Coccidioides posadasii str. Silveira]|uniref:DNA mismatch repair protein mutL n=1 Tax=Coccidioides posadasii (strain RMSCC 757 / Silveira) TaxID=443226 RepID=E9D6K6_COCPS|nr:DNA mismatch repair protein mutL [Coccidioides posadasii str. Silveira]